MKTLKLIFVFTLIPVMLLCSCSSQSTAPWDMPGSLWCDQTNGITFTVPDSADGEIYGAYSTEDESTELIVMHNENNIAFFDKNCEDYEWENALLQGACKYDDLIMTVIVEESSIETIEAGSAIFFFKSDSDS